MRTILASVVLASAFGLFAIIASADAGTTRVTKVNHADMTPAQHAAWLAKHPSYRVQINVMPSAYRLFTRQSAVHVSRCLVKGGKTVCGSLIEQGDMCWNWGAQSCCRKSDGNIGTCTCQWCIGYTVYMCWW